MCGIVNVLQQSRLVLSQHPPSLPPPSGRCYNMAALCVGHLQDNSDQGIKATMARLSRLLARHDPELHTHLEAKSKVGRACPFASALPRR